MKYIRITFSRSGIGSFKGDEYNQIVAAYHEGQSEQYEQEDW